VIDGTHLECVLKTSGNEIGGGWSRLVERRRRVDLNEPTVEVFVNNKICSIQLKRVLAMPHLMTTVRAEKKREA
jgi:hypothetical protein